MNVVFFRRKAFSNCSHRQRVCLHRWLLWKWTITLSTL